MFNESSGIVKIILSILFFPMFFQEAFINFAWGAEDEFWIMLLKRLFLLLPAFAVILACWLTIACFLTVLVRHKRQAFVTSLFVTWWDLGKSIVTFWGGIFKFVFTLFAAVLGLIKVLIFAIWGIIQDIIFLPFRLIRGVGQNVVSSPVPWIALFLTFFWCLVEAVIFTYVTTPLVIDTFSNITGEELTVTMVRIPLFVFLFIVVLGSYAVLSTFIDAVKSKKVGTIVGITIIEIVVLFVEVVFLYREFVDSLVPWFAQYSENFELGIFGTLAIASFVWFGVRSLSWVLFAAHGTPTLMSIIQGKGVKVAEDKKGTVLPKRPIFEISSEFMKRLKEDTAWIQSRGEDVLASFMLPPLQVIGAAINFCTLLVIANHLFELPFKNIESITNSRLLMESTTKKSQPVHDD
jgi:hypothetical protein